MRRVAEGALVLFGAAVLVSVAADVVAPLLPALGGLAVLAGVAYWLLGSGGPRGGSRGWYR